MYLWESGLTRYWVDHISPNAYECFDKTPPKDTVGQTGIKLEDLTSAYLILGTGLGLSIISFLFEVIVGKCCKFK